MAEQVVLRLLPSGEKVRVPAGTPLADAAARIGVPLELPCGGRGRCGGCRVLVLAGDAPPTPPDRERLSEEEVARGVRLACALRLRSDLDVLLEGGERAAVVEAAPAAAPPAPWRPAIVRRTISVPPATIEEQLPDLDRLSMAWGATLRARLGALRGLHEALAASETTVAVEDGELIAACADRASGPLAGIALDVGTTTVSASLLDLETGEILGSEGTLNRQVRFGADVISRITRTMEDAAALEDLRRAAVETVADLARGLAGAGSIPIETVAAATVAGNPAMIHLLLGVPPRGLGLAPYVGVLGGPLLAKASDLELPIHPNANVFVFPSIASHVGGDIVADLLVSRAVAGPRPRACIDLGTNAEIVVGDRSRALACSTAAGPAFEGATIRMGMRASEGAIHRVDLEGDTVAVRVIGGAEPRGICGTGLVDAVAALLEAGIVDETGRMRRPEELPRLPDALRRRIEETPEGLAFRLAGEDRPVRLYATDVRELQLVKGSIGAGLATLLAELGIGTRDLEAVLLAGAFGSFVRPASARRIGLVPDGIVVRALGNAACAGARRALLDAGARREAAAIARFVGYVELAAREGYPRALADAMSFPPRAPGR